jgi:hypothetical protein
MTANSRARASRVAAHGGEQHHQPGRQREAEQELDRTDHLVEHALHLAI